MGYIIITTIVLILLWINEERDWVKVKKVKR
jgi:hypothetical protein